MAYFLFQPIQHQTMIFLAPRLAARASSTRFNNSSAASAACTPRVSPSARSLSLCSIANRAATSARKRCYIFVCVMFAPPPGPRPIGKLQPPPRKEQGSSRVQAALLWPRSVIPNLRHSHRELVPLGLAHQPYCASENT